MKRADMDKPYFLLQSEHDSTTAIDDILNCSERDDAWAFKHDLLVADDSARICDMVDARKPALAGPLDAVPFLHDVYTKEESVEEESVDAKSSCANSFPFPGLGELAKPHRPDLVPAGGSPAHDNQSAGNSQDLTALSTAPSIPFTNNEEGERNDYCSENEQPIECWDGCLDDKIPGVHQHLDYSSNVPGRPDNSNCRTRKEVQKPPTTAGIGLEDLKAVFHLERPKAEKQLRLKRTTFSNLSRHYGISKWPFRTIRDAMNRMKANQKLLTHRNVSKERQRKLVEQQRLLTGVIKLIYSDPKESRDSNTLAVLLRIVASRESRSRLCEPGL